MSVIEMHSTWLAINSIIGCSNGCRYCLLQGNNDNKTQPKEMVSPSMAVKELINSKYYDSSIPVCLLPNTDPFLNKKNIKYLKDLIIELDKNSIYNVLTIITKCKITNDVIDLVKLMELKGHKIIFYISYSGLNNIMEPNINANDIKYNFKLLKENNIPIVHYFRPLLPQNSSKKIIDDVLNYVKKYTNISVISGLNLIPTFIDKIDFWDEIKENKEICLKSSSVYPYYAWNYFKRNNIDLQIFQTNTCALNTVLSAASHYYGSYECKNYNRCSKMQRRKCKLLSFNMHKKSVKEECNSLLKKLGYDISKVKYRFDKLRSLEIINLELSIADLTYLSYMLHFKVYIRSNKIVNYTYNNSLNGAKPLIMKASGNNE